MNRLRVMQSFKKPRPTTNPYIVQLDRALASQPALDHVRFSWKAALLTRFDVIHFHWPETLLGADRRWKRWGKRMLFRALLIKLSATNTAIVRTVHNVDLPDVDRPARRLLKIVEERADFRITLNGQTHTAGSAPSLLIPHGHYRDWFAEVRRIEPQRNTLGFVGLVRRYKGVEQLIDAFIGTSPTHPDLHLEISGNPTSDGLAEEVRRLSEEDPRITVDLRFLTEDDFAMAVMRSMGVVLPYTFMHNSGTVLAALSLSRPVLVPRNEVNTALAAEVGPGWVHFFDGVISADDLAAFRDAIASVPAAPPNLAARDWTRAGSDHVEAFRSAVAAHRQRHRRAQRVRR